MLCNVDELTQTHLVLHQTENKMAVPFFSFFSSSPPLFLSSASSFPTLFYVIYDNEIIERILIFKSLDGKIT